jgi:hypothetical protein
MSTVTFFSTDCNGICEVPVVNHIDILAHWQQAFEADKMELHDLAKLQLLV